MMNLIFKPGHFFENLKDKEPKLLFPIMILLSLGVVEGIVYDRIFASSADLLHYSLFSSL